MDPFFLQGLSRIRRQESAEEFKEAIKSVRTPKSLNVDICLI